LGKRLSAAALHVANSFLIKGSQRALALPPSRRLQDVHKAGRVLFGVRASRRTDRRFDVITLARIAAQFTRQLCTAKLVRTPGAIKSRNSSISNATNLLTDKPACRLRVLTGKKRRCLPNFRRAGLIAH
jgi:hypothetical protein